MAWVLHHAILPLVDRLRPQAIMVQCGADALEDDPLARLSLSNNAHRAVVAALMGRAPRLIVLGGGGYNPWSVARCWAGVWGVLAGHAMPARLPPAAEAVLRALRDRPAMAARAASPAFSLRAAWRDPPEHWFTTLADAPRPGVVRAAVRRAAAAALAGLPGDPPCMA
jgi:acetoin utilization protein AcuC